MDKKITDFLVKEIKIGKWMLAPIDLLLFVAAAVFSVMIRISVVDYTAIELPAFVKCGNMLSIVTGITDLLLAVLGAMIVYDLTGRKIRAFLAYAILLMLPVLCASCAMWDMGDSIYIFFAVLSLYLLMKDKGNAYVFFQEQVDAVKQIINKEVEVSFDGTFYKIALIKEKNNVKSKKL